MLKLFLALVLFVVAALGGIAAWIVRTRGGHFLLFAEAFTGGALLNAALVHLLADAAKDLREMSEYPLAELLCGFGFMLTHMLEPVILTALSARDRHKLHKHGHRVPTAPPGDQEKSPVAGNVASTVIGKSAELGHSEATGNSDQCNSSRNSGTNGAFAAATIDGESICGAKEEVSAMPSFVLTSLVAGPLLMLALSVHSLLEGLSLGAANTSRALGLFLAIFAHKGIAALSLGIAWSRTAKSKLQYATGMAMFSSVTPFGILLGAPVEGSVFGTWVTALSAGTFLYVGLIEACPGVQSSWLPGTGAVWQAVAFLGGFGCMAVLGLWL